MTNLPVPVSAWPGNPHTRLSHTRWVHRFLTWCDHHYTVDLANITPGIAARFMDELARAVSNQRLALAALRRFFDVLVGAVTDLRLQDLRDHGSFRTFWFREKRGYDRRAKKVTRNIVERISV